MKKNINEFLEEYKLLCEKYGLHLESEDPYCGLEVCELTDYPDQLIKKYSDNEKS
jgi:hypothetical protein